MNNGRASTLAAIVVTLIFSGSMRHASAQLVTITDATPEPNSWFGLAVAPLGISHVIVGAPNKDIGATGAGQAYLFDTNGTLVTTFTNPAPSTWSGFGTGVAGVGGDRILIVGILGSAYLFDQTGALLTTYTNTSNTLGRAVAALGTDRVVIGAQNSKQAYLFSTNGILLTTFTNSSKGEYTQFGESLAVVGTEAVVIGAYGDSTGATNTGAAYVFHTNGTLLTTITNPSPDPYDYFGYQLAPLGSDRVVISAFRDSTGAPTAGIAYLHKLDGTLLSVITNPFPQPLDSFGTVTAIGDKWIVVGAPSVDGNQPGIGRAYLFDTNGTLMNVFTNPTPFGFDQFGLPVATLGADRVLIAANEDDLAGQDTGSVYIYDIFPHPALNLTAMNGTNLLIQWETPEPGLVLQQAEALSLPTDWIDVGGLVSTNGLTNLVEQLITPETTNRFYRLRRP